MSSGLVQCREVRSHRYVGFQVDATCRGGSRPVRTADQSACSAASRGVQAAGRGLARDAEAVVVVSAVRDHLGGLTRREARGRAEPGGAVAVTRPEPAPGALVARVDVEPPARCGPNAASPAPQPWTSGTRTIRPSLRS